MSQFKDFLANYNDAFDKAEVQAFSRLPDGVYQGNVDVMRFEPNNKTGGLFLLMEFTVCVGEYTGRKIFHRRVIKEDPIYMNMLKTDLDKLNIHPIPFDTLEDYFPGMIGKIVELQLKTGKPNMEGKTYQNTYINKLIGEAPTPNNNQDNDLPF